MWLGFGLESERNFEVVHFFIDKNVNKMVMLNARSHISNPGSFFFEFPVMTGSQILAGDLLKGTT